MAVLTLSGIATSIHGSVGGTTFKRHRGGFSVCTKPHPEIKSAKPTRPQILNLSQIAAAWRGLSTAARDAWTRALKSYIETEGPDVHAQFPAPYVLFQFYNLARTRCGLAIVSAAPTSFGNSKPLAPQLSYSPYWQIIFMYNTDPVLSGEYALEYVSHPIPANQKNPRTWNWIAFGFLGPYSGYSYLSLPNAVQPGTTLRVSTVRIQANRLPSPPFHQTIKLT